MWQGMLQRLSQNTPDQDNMLLTRFFGHYNEGLERDIAFCFSCLVPSLQSLATASQNLSVLTASGEVVI